MCNFYSRSIDETKSLGRKFAKVLEKGDMLVLSGDLGAGKTAFTSGILSFYDKENEVSSPTFTIINEYDLKEDLKLFHFDVYRFDYEDEFTAIGGEEFFSKGICVIEWGEKIRGLLPNEYLEIVFEHDEKDLNSRKITFIPRGEKYEKLAKEVM